MRGDTTMPHEYEIIIPGDDYLQTKIYLTDEEYAAFDKVIKSMEATGPYAPVIQVRDLTKMREQALEDAKKAVEEERKRFPTAMQMAFQKAQSK